MWWLALLAWVAGYLVAVQPVYRAIMRAHTANKMRSGKRVEPGEVVSAIFGANAAALVWPLMVPWLLSRAAFGGGSGRRLEFQAEIEKFRDDHADAERVRNQLAQGRREIEATAQEVTRRRPPVGWD